MNTEVRFSYASLGSPQRPDIPLLWKNQKFIDWANKAGYDSTEFHPFRAVTREINKLTRTPNYLPMISSGHVIPNPYANWPDVIKRKPDPLRPNHKLGFYNLAYAPNIEAITALTRLERLKEPDLFPIVTYPYTLEGQQPYGDFTTSLIQAHPSVFDDERSLPEIASHSKDGIVLDIYHALEATSTGNRPLKDWKEYPKLIAENVKIVHLQVSRVTENDPTIPSERWLKDMTNGIFDSEIGHTISFIKKHNPTVPFVIEVTLEGLIKAKIAKRTDLLLNLDNPQIIHTHLISFIKEIQ